MPTLIQSCRPLRIAALAATAGLVLATTGAVGGAHATSERAFGAAFRQATAGPLDWGYKTSFRTYVAEEIARLPNGSQTRSSIDPSAGATFDGNVPSARTPIVNKAPYTWPLRGGSVDPSTGAGSVSYGGTVTFAYPNHFIQRFAVSNPRIVFDGKGGGGVYLDLSYDTGGGGGEPATTTSLDDVEIATLAGAKVTVSGNRATMTNATATLTAAGSKAVNGYSSAGDALDPVSFTVTLAAATSRGSGGSSGSGTTGGTSGDSTKPGGSSSTPRDTAASGPVSATTTTSPSASSSASASTSTSASPDTTDSTASTAPAPVVTDVAANDDAGSKSSSTGLIVLVLVAAALLAAGGGGWLARRRNPPSPPTLAG